MSLLSKWFGGKPPKDPNRAAAQALASLKAALGDELVSVLLYGSAATGDYSEKLSDINLLVVTRKLDSATLNKLISATRNWARQGIIKPMFFGDRELKASADVFPIEFLDIQDNRKVLHGDDPFRRITIDQRNLRHQLEFEIKSKLIAFRQRYLAGEASGQKLKDMIGQLVASLLPVFRALLKLKRNRPVNQRVRVIEDTCRYFRLHRKTFLQAHDIRYRGMEISEKDAQDLFEKMMGELERLGQAVDQIRPEGGATSSSSSSVPAEAGEGDRGRGRSGGRWGGRSQSRDRDRQPPVPREKLQAVRQLLSDLENKKRWEPKETERFSSDQVSRDSSQGLDARFGWDRAWVRFKDGKGEAPVTKRTVLEDGDGDSDSDDAGYDDSGNDQGRDLDSNSIEVMPEEKISRTVEVPEEPLVEAVETVEESPVEIVTVVEAATDQVGDQEETKERPAATPAATRHLGSLDEKNRAVVGPPLQARNEEKPEDKIIEEKKESSGFERLPEEKFNR